MDLSEGKRMHRALWIAMVAAVGLAACGEKPPAEKAAKAVQPAPVAPAMKMESAQPAPAAKAAEPSRESLDAELAAKVKSAVIGDPMLGKLTVDVSSKDGVVTLFGTADTAANRTKATQVAAAVPGVKSVENRMVLVAGS